MKAFFASAESHDARLAQEQAAKAGYDSVAAITDRRKVKLIGFISSMVLHPKQTAASVEADLNDGTGTITLVWLGRHDIDGIVPGARLSVEGFAARRDGRRVMYNPRYRLHRSAEED
ncbi:single stranded DNA-binding domain-containing protein [Devriesea agamarum]|uniref:hypothetical protein n=1 Tax=Devriesea agamarum TaxID=472569 RepID=UPI001E5D219E|nr:hypothetical protein [Devriesea agamarum]